MPEVKTGIKYSQGEQGATLQHYNLEPRIFELFLDPYMKYTCGLYPTGKESLAEAQLNSLEFIARQLNISGGEQVLDVGCGWGSLLLFLAQRFSCRGWGVTPALNQVEYVHKRALDWGQAPLIKVEHSHFQDLYLPSETFDAVTFVGSSCHMDDKQGVLQECYRLLKPKGRIYISESCFRNRRKYEELSDRPSTRFVHEEVFGWGNLVPLSVILSALEDAGFSLTGLTDLTNHYYHTNEDWMNNINQNSALLEAIQPGVVDKLLRCLEIANAAWGFTTKQYAVVATKKR